MTQRSNSQLVPYAPQCDGGSRDVGLGSRRDANHFRDVTRRDKGQRGGPEFALGQQCFLAFALLAN